MLNPMDYQGTDSGPGKFEGEPNATRYYWELVMEGDGEDHYPSLDDAMAANYSHAEALEDVSPYTLFCADSNEEAAFEDQDIHCGDTVVVFEDSQGFVNLWAFKSREAALHHIDKHAGVI